ncbi:DUF5131 family protein [Methylobacterium aquaticum]|uniref:DUF5131 family protein n=1 Tax=Methylobacterium aquaticum TaxID=270351 RepID=UPI003D17A2C1
MAENTKIEWTRGEDGTAGATWNVVTGCSVATPGCTNCYAMRLAGTRLQHHPSRAGLTRETKAGPVWTGEVRFNEQWLTQPFQWKRPRKIFVAAHGDLFHEGVPDDVLDQVFAVMGLADWHTYQVLTKRSARMRAYLSDPATVARIEAAADAILDAECERFNSTGARMRIDRGLMGMLRTVNGKTDVQVTWPFPNIWLGVSVEDQRRADERRPDLEAVAAAGWTTFVSYEPALEAVDWAGWEFLAWLISGGESGPGARPTPPEGHRWARDFCAAHGIPYFFKQWGSWAPGECVTRTSGIVEAAWYDDPSWTFGTESLSRTDGHIDDEPDVYRIGKAAAGRLLDGVQHDGFPEARR